jgi:hypothetical protein
MSSVVISGDTSGAITLSAPAVAGTNTITLPASTGTVALTSLAPSFSVYKNATGQSFTQNTATKVTFDVEQWDTNNNFASSTFTPTVAGYYQFNGGLDVGANSNTLTRANILFYKNGGVAYQGAGNYSGYTGTEIAMAGSCLIYCNGSTDYVELYVYATGTSPIVYTGAPNVYFQGVFVKG